MIVMGRHKKIMTIGHQTTNPVVRLRRLEGFDIDMEKQEESDTEVGEGVTGVG